MKFQTLKVSRVRAHGEFEGMARKGYAGQTLNRKPQALNCVCIWLGQWVGVS